MKPADYEQLEKDFIAERDKSFSVISRWEHNTGTVKLIYDRGLGKFQLFENGHFNGDYDTLREAIDAYEAIK